MSETNPAPTTQPPADPAAPPAAPPATPPATSPAAPTQPPAASGTPDVHGLMNRLETVLQGLPERTANAVREASPQHVPNPTANPQQQQPPNQPPPPGENPAGKAGGPSKFAKWWHGISG